MEKFSHPAYLFEKGGVRGIFILAKEGCLKGRQPLHKKLLPLSFRRGG
jgi:hypothetical protein